VIAFKKNATANSCTVEMDIEDFINLTNLINESIRDESRKMFKHPVTTHRYDVTEEVPFQPPPSQQPPSKLNDVNLAPSHLNKSPQACATITPSALAPMMSYKFWNHLTSNSNTTEEETAVAGQSSDNGEGLSFAELGISALTAILLPHTAGIIRLMCQNRFYATPIHFLVHNRSGFWIQNAWNPNTFFAEQSETEDWILRRMLPSICLLSVGSWLVFLFSSSSSSSSAHFPLAHAPIPPLSFASGFYASFLVTHWADCSTTDLVWSTRLRGLASIELFFVTFAFKSWSLIAGLTALPAFSLYSWLFFTTYKTRQKLRRHQQAIDGYDDEINDNTNNFASSEFKDSYKVKGSRQPRPPSIMKAQEQNGGVIEDWWRRKSDSRTGFATFWWIRQKDIAEVEEEARHGPTTEPRSDVVDNEFD